MSCICGITGGDQYIAEHTAPCLDQRIRTLEAANNALTESGIRIAAQRDTLEAELAERDQDVIDLTAAGNQVAEERDALAEQNSALREALLSVRGLLGEMHIHTQGHRWDTCSGATARTDFCLVASMVERICAAQPTPGAERAPQEVHLVFDASPGPESCRFIEAELADGRSVRVGEWYERQDGSGQWELRILAVLPERVTEEQ